MTGIYYDKEEIKSMDVMCRYTGLTKEKINKIIDKNIHKGKMIINNELFIIKKKSKGQKVKNHKAENIKVSDVEYFNEEQKSGFLKVYIYNSEIVSLEELKGITRIAKTTLKRLTHNVKSIVINGFLVTITRKPSGTLYEVNGIPNKTTKEVANLFGIKSPEIIKAFTDKSELFRGGYHIVRQLDFIYLENNKQ